MPKYETPNSTIDHLLGDLETLAPKAQEYLVLFLDMLSTYEKQNEYREHPEEVKHCFPKGLYEDINEIIFLLKECMDALDKKEMILEVLSELKIELGKAHPVLSYALENVFLHFKIVEGPVEKEASVRFKTANLLWDRVEWTRFFRACHLSEETEGGKGSHVKWKDRKGEWPGFSLVSTSGKMWFKTKVKEMIESGFPIERIKTACEELKVDFQVI